jgi:membrane-bound lytic murein transglycosylase D
LYVSYQTFLRFSHLSLRVLPKRFDWRALALFATAVLLAGCAARSRRAQVHPPSTISRRIPSLSADIAQLPLARSGNYPSLVPAIRPAVDVLIEEVEKNFEQGEQDYQANHLQQARQHFQSAIRALTQSGMNFSVDPRLEPLMDRLVNTMHEDQVRIGEASAASGAGAAGTQPAAQTESTPEPESPIEEIASAVANLPPNPEVDQIATAELLHIPHDLPLTVNQAVLTYLDFFETPRGRDIIARSLARSGRYIGMVKQVLKQEGLPLDLMYLPLPESGYQPRAVSRVGARGLWQFMPETGRLYGLKINRWEDQRMDPVASTRAAAEHLRDLYNTFHDWYLVLAAYDAGSLTVARAIERTGYADFWKLYDLNAFPVETKNYVPIMLAMTLVAKDPSLYGVNITDPQKPLVTEAFRPGRSIDLELVADAIGVSVKTLRNLNPELFGVVTPDDPTFVLRLPAHTKSELESVLASIPQSRWVGWRLHRVEDGETIDTVAAQYHVRSASLAEANNVSLQDPLSPGQLLLIPAPVPPAAIFYRVRPGDTVGGIAARYRVSIFDVRLWNHLRSNLIRVGQVLRINAREGEPRFEQASERRPVYSSSDPVGSSPRARRIHIARYGDTLWSISRKYGVSLESLRAANPIIARYGLRAGERVVIPK